MDNKLKKLESMTGKKYLYNAKEITLLTYKQDGEDIIIVTDKEWVTIPVYDLLVELDKFKLIEEPQLPARKNGSDLGLMAAPADTLVSLRDTLIDNINKVKEDPAYIPQAKSISYNIQTIINLAKIELETRKSL